MIALPVFPRWRLDSGPGGRPPGCCGDAADPPSGDWLPGRSRWQCFLTRSGNGIRFNLRSDADCSRTVAGRGQLVLQPRPKRGFSEPDLRRGGGVGALLAILRHHQAPEAPVRFRSCARHAVARWPLGSKAAGHAQLLVAVRFQVKGDRPRAICRRPQARHELLESYRIFTGPGRLRPALVARVSARKVALSTPLRPQRIEIPPWPWPADGPPVRAVWNPSPRDLRCCPQGSLDLRLVLGGWTNHHPVAERPADPGRDS